MIDAIKSDPDFSRRDSERMKKFHEENPNARIEHSKKLEKYYKEHPEKGIEHGEKVREFYKNPEEREKHKKRMKQYYDIHPEAGRKISERRKGQRISPETEFKKGGISWNKGKGKKYKKMCKGCGIEFETSLERQKFHLRSCYDLYRKESNDFSQKRRELTVKQLSSKNWKFKKTSIEVAIGDELERVGLNYQSNVPLCKIGVVDFYLPDYDIIIQCDGDYWHNRPEVKQRDVTQDLVYSFNSYKVFRFWEHEIKESPKKCINKVLKYIKVIKCQNI